LGIHHSCVFNWHSSVIKYKGEEYKNIKEEEKIEKLF
jgi:hypothetical protein